MWGGVRGCGGGAEGGRVADLVGIWSRFKTPDEVESGSFTLVICTFLVACCGRDDVGREAVSGSRNT